VSDLVLLTNAHDDATRVLPALRMLSYRVHVAPANPASARSLDRAHVVIVDGRIELPTARALCRLLRTTHRSHTVLTVVTEGGLAGVNGDWQLDDVLVDTASPAEVGARLRLAHARLASDIDARVRRIEHGALQIDPESRSVHIAGERVVLTFQEFELLAHLARNPGRVFSRAELLTQVWGHRSPGGTRTVDVHVRRVRQALGDEHADHIGTVRRIGYKFVPDPWRAGLPARVSRLQPTG
jgi:DNA-binding response OmpR family regulator